MKLKELKHNHSLTDLLKVLIFSILMITPLLSVATRCLYVICNKNAYQSAEITQTTYDKVNKYQTNVVNNISTNFVNGNIYKFQTDEFLNNEVDGSYVSFENCLCIITHTGETIVNSNYVQYFTTSYLNIFRSSDAVSFDNDNFGTPTFFMEIYENTDEVNDFNIYLVNFDNVMDNLDFPYYFYFDESDFFLFDYVEVESTTLDNVFEYSVNKLAESPILSWTQQTAIYTGVSTMTTQLGISTPTIAMLIVYWFLLTVIYIIIDIIIKLFTWLTHMIGSKSV